MKKIVEISKTIGNRTDDLWSKISIMLSTAAVVSAMFLIFFIKYIHGGTISEGKGNAYKSSITLRSESKHDIRTFIKSSSNVLGIAIIDLDFSKNKKYIVYTDIVDPSGNFNENSDDDKLLTIPIFTTDDTPNNHLVVKMMGGEIHCYPTRDMFTAVLLPEVSTRSNWACSSPIPPFYGNFKGFLTVFLKNPVRGESDENIRSHIRNLSLSIYNNDIR